MSSLLESPIAAQASSLTSGVTSGAVARMADTATLPQSELPIIQGGRHHRRRSSKRRSSKRCSKGRKSQRRRSRRLRRPFFLL